MLKYIYVSLISFCLLAANAPSFAQKWEVGTQAGISGYIGDMNPYKIYPIQRPKPTFGLFGAYHFKPEWSVRMNFNYIPLEGADADWKNDPKADPQLLHRDLDFKNTLFEGSAVVDFEFYEFRSSRSQTLFTPYIFAGAGMVFHNPKRKGSVHSLIDNLIEARNYEEITKPVIPDPADGEPLTSQPAPKPYSKYVPIIPIGAGFKVNLQGEWSIGIQLSYRFPIGGSRDFLDGVSKTYLPFSTIESHQATLLDQNDWEGLAGGKNNAYSDLEGKMRGTNLKGADRYLTTVLTLSYSIYKWRDPSWK